MEPGCPQPAKHSKIRTNKSTIFLTVALPENGHSTVVKRKRFSCSERKEFEIYEKAGNKEQRKFVHQREKWSPNKLVDRTQNGAIFAI